MKEGSISTMWRVNLSGIKELFRDDNYPVEWEPVVTAGRNPGKISHHKAFVMNEQNVLIYGGLKGEDSSADIWLFNAVNSNWTTMQYAVSDPSVTKCRTLRSKCLQETITLLATVVMAVLWYLEVLSMASVWMSF